MRKNPVLCRTYKPYPRKRITKGLILSGVYFFHNKSSYSLVIGIVRRTLPVLFCSWHLKGQNMKCCNMTLVLPYEQKCEHSTGAGRIKEQDRSGCTACGCRSSARHPMYTKPKGLLRGLLTAHVGEVSTKQMQRRRQTELMRTRLNKKVVWAHIIQKVTAPQS